MLLIKSYNFNLVHTIIVFHNLGTERLTVTTTIISRNVTLEKKPLDTFSFFPRSFHIPPLFHFLNARLNSRSTRGVGKVAPEWIPPSPSLSINEGGMNLQKITTPSLPVRASSTGNHPFPGKKGGSSMGGGEEEQHLAGE